LRAVWASRAALVAFPCDLDPSVAVVCSGDAERRRVAPPVGPERGRSQVAVLLCGLCFADQALRICLVPPGAAQITVTS